MSFRKKVCTEIKFQGRSGHVSSFLSQMKLFPLKVCLPSLLEVPSVIHALES